MNDGMMSYEDVLDQLGESQRAARLVLPCGENGSYYPTTINVLGLEPSAKAGTPGLRLLLPVTHGPFKGEVVPEMDSTIWLTPGKPTAKRPGAMMGMLNHMTHQVTGQRPDVSAFQAHGFVFPQGCNIGLEFANQFAGLDSDTKVAFMRTYCRVEAWNGKAAVLYLTAEEEERQDASGEPMKDEAGNVITVWKNQIRNIFSVNHERYGLAYYEQVEAAKQEAWRRLQMEASAATGPQE